MAAHPLLYRVPKIDGHITAAALESQRLGNLGQLLDSTRQFDLKIDLVCIPALTSAKN